MTSRLFLSALLVTVLTVPALATTFVLVSDDDLVDQAAVVVQAIVLSRDDSPAQGMPSTDYVVEVERVLKGSIPGSSLLVRVPGGFRPDGIGLKIFGAPAFAEGERVLLFLGPRRDGSFRILHLMMGAFHQVDIQGQALAVRSFGEARELALPNDPRTPEELALERRARHLGRFSTWIEERAEGRSRPADYRVSLTEASLSAQVERFRLFENPDTGFNMRWFEFDTGGEIPWRYVTGGQPGLTAGETETAIRQGIDAWNNDNGSNVRYRLLGTTSATAGFQNPDGVNAVAFADPNSNPEFEGRFRCPGGGVLAIGGPWIFNNTTPYRGKQYHRIGEGDIVTNIGIDCFFLGSPNKQLAAAELFGHELGHTLGLAHSSENGGEPNTLWRDALMFFAIHDDARGARLNSDDRAAIRALYGVASQGPAAPSGLSATAISATEVLLSWTDNSTNETVFDVQRKVAGGSYSTVASPPADTTSFTVNGLTEETSYVFRVRARNGSGSSAFSNEANARTPLPAPSDFLADPVSSTTIHLTWLDRSASETSFRVEIRSPLTEFTELAVLPAGSEELMVNDLAQGLPFSFRITALNDAGSSLPVEAHATTPAGDGPVSPCVADAESLCLLGDRFRVKVRWANQRVAGDNGVGRAVPVAGSDITGLFWFFDQENIELIVKMIDGRGFNGFFWTFYGALSDVTYWVSVEDTVTGESRTYYNPPGEICGIGDVQSFVPVEELPVLTSAGPQQARQPTVVSFPDVDPAPVTQAVVQGCVEDAETLCLFGNRFAVNVAWDNPRIEGDSGKGGALPGIGTDQTGFFWFFDPDNIELVVKILDGRQITGNFWFFWGGLSDVEYRITVTDTATGAFKVYTNAAFNICGGADLNAL